MVSVLANLLRLYAINLLFIRVLTLVLSLGLLVSAKYFLNIEQADDIFLSLSYTQSLITLLIFGFDKAIWRSNKTDRPKLYNSWFGFFILIAITLVLIGTFINRVPETILSFPISIMFLRSWEDQAENKLLRSTVVFTGLLPTAFLAIVFGVFFSGLPLSTIILIISGVLFIIAYTLNLFEGLKVDYSQAKVALYNNLFYVIPPFIVSLGLYMILEYFAGTKEGLVFQYSGIVRLMAGIRVFSFVFNRLSINKGSKNIIRRYYVIFLPIVAVAYVGILWQFKDLILVYLGIELEDYVLLLLAAGIVFIEYIGTQETFTIIARDSQSFLLFGSIVFLVVSFVAILLVDISVKDLFIVLIAGHISKFIVLYLHRLGRWKYT